MDKLKADVAEQQGVQNGQLGDLKVSELRAGSAARVAGCTRSENPWRRHEAMPMLTGGNEADWRARALSWELGWDLENMARSETDASAAIATIDVLERELNVGAIWTRPAP